MGIIKRFAHDKRGDAMMIFIIMLIMIFGILTIDFTGATQTSTMRQKIYNAVQDGLTIAIGKSLAIDSKTLTLNVSDAKNRVLTSLSNNNINVKNLKVWYANNRIYASGTAVVGHLGVETSTTENIPFEYYVDVHRNFR
jgi:Flp pilus assembly protein TadG